MKDIHNRQEADSLQGWLPMIFSPSQYVCRFTRQEAEAINPGVTLPLEHRLALLVALLQQECPSGMFKAFLLEASLQARHPTTAKPPQCEKPKSTK